MRFNAGSEIYTQMLTHGLIKEHEVRVFTRKENPFRPDYHRSQEKEFVEGTEIYIDLINVARQKDRYQSDGVDQVFEEVIGEFNPDIVHFQHLNHLSLGLISIAKQSGARLIYTLHDYWLACPRGQFIQINYGEPEPLQLCSSQEDTKCATHCYSRYHRGTEDKEEDITYWTTWVRRRREIIDTIVEQVDYFIAPSHHLKARMQEELGINNRKIIYLDYGFDLQRFNNRKRAEEKDLLFGFIGTHTVPKGIHHLLKAFDMLEGDIRLRIWGRDRPGITSYLKEIHHDMLHNGERVEWLNEYSNENIVSQVFNNVDIIVVPSIWDENSPLVIHEALQCRIPVITADHGGMAEYIQHLKNGLLFDFRDIDDLARKMQLLIDKPYLIKDLGDAGYLQSDEGNIIGIEEHVNEINKIYTQVMEESLWIK